MYLAIHCVADFVAGQITLARNVLWGDGMLPTRLVAPLRSSGAAILHRYLTSKDSATLISADVIDSVRLFRQLKTNDPPFNPRVRRLFPTHATRARRNASQLNNLDRDPRVEGPARGLFGSRSITLSFVRNGTPIVLIAWPYDKSVQTNPPSGQMDRSHRLDHGCIRGG